MVLRPPYARVFGPGSGPPAHSEPSLGLVCVAPGRREGSLLLCGMGTCFVLIPSPLTPVQRKPLLHVSVVTYRLLCSSQVLRHQRPKAGSSQTGLSFLPFHCFLEKRMWTSGSASRGRWQREQIPEAMTRPLSAYPKHRAQHAGRGCSEWTSEQEKVCAQGPWPRAAGLGFRPCPG